MPNTGVGRKWASFMAALMLLGLISDFFGTARHQCADIRTAKNRPRIRSRH